MAIDPVNDLGAVHLTHVTRVVDLPQFVKVAAMPTPAEVNDLPSSSFADPVRREYPVHTKAACWLSHAYFQLQKHGLDKRAATRIESSFQRHGQFWTISDEMSKVANVVNNAARPSEKQASTTSYALNVSTNGKQFKLFPVDSPSAVVKSAAHLDKERGKLTYNMRKEAATGILKAAGDYGVSVSALPESLPRMAGHGITVKQAALQELDRRKHRARTTAEKTAAAPLVTLRTVIDNGPAVLSGDVIKKVAQVLDMHDRFTGTTELYGSEFAFPEDVLFGCTETSLTKVSSETVALITGSAYWLSDLEKASAALRVLGDDVFGDLCQINGGLDLSKVADVLPTLPRGDATALETALNLQGIPKVAMDTDELVNHAMGTTYTKAPEKTAAATEVDSKYRRAARIKLARAREILSSVQEDVGAEDQSPEDQSPVATQPRKGDGRFITKAPNTTETVLMNQE